MPERRGRTLRLLLLMPLLVFAIQPGLASGQKSKPVENGEEAPVIAVRLYNLAEAPAKETVQARNEARRIFMQAGIGVRWLICALSLQEAQKNTACEEPSGPHDLDLVISTASITRPGIATDASLGFAFPLARQSQAVVLLERATKLAASSGVPAGIILGHSMAHEIGHLLMQSMEHSRAGIMRSRWGKDELHHAERGTLLFTPEQTIAMRNRLLKE